MNKLDKNRQTLIYSLAIIVSAILCLLDKWSGETSQTIITGVLLYVAGRYTPYNGGESK